MDPRGQVAPWAAFLPTDLISHQAYRFITPLPLLPCPPPLLPRIEEVPHRMAALLLLVPC